MIDLDNDTNPSEDSGEALATASFPTTDENKIGELLEGLPERKKESIIKLVASMHSGPLPPASTLEGYAALLPDAVERVFTMAEREQAHRHKMNELMAESSKREISIQETESKNSFWMGKASLFFGCIIFLILIALIVLSSYLGLTSAVIALGSVAAFGIITEILRFAHNTRKINKDSELKEKSQGE